MDDSLIHQLERETRHRACVLGQRLAILGATPVAAQLVGMLHSEGLDSRLVGVFDHRKVPSAAEHFHPMEAIVDQDLDVIIVADDAGKEELLLAFQRVDSRLPEVVICGTGHFDFRDSHFEALLHSSVGVSLANGYPYSLVHLYQCLQHAARHRLEGHIAEFGVFKGGTTVLLAKFAEHFGLRGTRIFGFDTFGGFPPRRSVLDLYDRPGCVFTDFDAVRRLCAPYPSIELVRGDIVETSKRLAGLPLILTFFDTDNYTPTRAALGMCIEQTVVGGSIVFDHYTSIERFTYTLGERMAAKEAFEDADFFHLHGTGVFTKTAPTRGARS
ncbi:MAG: TylF/MycF/NovP-related O-methyltransferase [Thermomicrobiales bacterium]